MATSSRKIPKVIVGGKHVTIKELHSLRDAVCLLKCRSKDKSRQWRGHGFYANVKLTMKQGETLNISCIITLYDDIFLEMEEHGSDMVAVFHHESDKKEAFELPLVPFKLLAYSKTKQLDYALISIDESKIKERGVKPILADSSQLPVVQPYDEVYMIHHPGKREKHSEDKAWRVTGSFIKYRPSRMDGPPGSPVFVFKDSKFSLVAMQRSNKREGVLVLHILDDLDIPREMLSWEVVEAASSLPEPTTPESSMSSSDDEEALWGQREASVYFRNRQSLRRPQRAEFSALQPPSIMRNYEVRDRLLRFMSQSGGSLGLSEAATSTSFYPDMAVKVITTDGGVLNIGNFTLRIGPGCLAEDTLITLESDEDQESAIRTLWDLSLVYTVPHVVKFLPAGLVFLKPADVTIRLERKTDPESEHFILHGSYNPVYEKTFWELVTNGIEENNEEGVINMKINHFSLFTYIKAKRGKLARILGHLNGYFTCCAYSFYRRMAAKDTIDISVVFLSEFVDQKEEEDIEQLKDHVQAGYVKGEKGFLKPVHTNRHLEVILDFPGIEDPPFLFKVRQAQLDSVGFAVDRFKRIAVKSPAIGAVKISEIKKRAKKESLWELNVCELEDEIRTENVGEEQSAPLEVLPEVIHRSTKLAVREIDAMSPKVGIDWDNLAALMDISYSEREAIRVNYLKYPSMSSKAKRVLELFNESKSFDRHILVKHFEELRRQDLKNEMPPMEDEGEEVSSGATATSKPEISEVQLQNDTPLSSREIYTLSRHLVVNWDRLAALLGITSAERDDIRYSLLYTSSHSKAEKMLTVFNNMENFSRQRLAECFEEIGQWELKEPVITGEWRR